jgi:spoIIIJ-associated protein
MDEPKLKINKKVLDSVREMCDQLFSLIGLKVNVDIHKDKENEAVLVNLSSDGSDGLLIGRRGETISALQYVLGIMLHKGMGAWVRVIVNVGDYREKQEDQLTELAKAAAERARETGEPQLLYNLNPSQRRVVHIVLGGEGDIETSSDGEGRDRHLVVTLKEK